MVEVSVTVLSNTLIAENTYKLTFKTDEIIGGIKAGMFVMLKPSCGELLLKRPFGILSSNKNEISVAYQVKGNGTENFKNAKAGDELVCLLPLGNGFEIGDAKRIALIGGGAGIFPLFSVAEQFVDRKIFAYLGFRNKAAVCLLNEFSKNCKTVVTTDDGSYNKKGNAVESFLEGYKTDKPNIILACGPKPMLIALKKALTENDIKTKTLVSLEERMGCGIGACLVCTCNKTDGGKARVCKDGPVFDIWEVEL